MGRYRKVDPRLWNDAKVRALSDEGKLVFLFILTHPTMTALGAMRASLAGLAGELGWPIETFRAAFGEALTLGMIEHDDGASFIALPNFMKYNRPENPNVLKSWVAALVMIPECPLRDRLLERVQSLVARLGKAFLKALPEAFGRPLANQEQEQEQKHEQEQEECKAGKPASPKNQKEKPRRHAAVAQPRCDPAARAGAGEWPRVDSRLQLMMDPESHGTWIAQARCLGLSPEAIWLEAPSDFHARWIRHNFTECIQQAACASLGLEEPPQLHCLAAS